MRPWSAVGISPDIVEPGDVLMEWRAHLSKEDEPPALRYVHIFTLEELTHLAVDNGFKIAETYYSDGKEGNLALYQKWVH